MAYSAGMLRERVTIVRRTVGTADPFGKDSAGVTYETVGVFWAAFSFKKGMKSIHEGAVDGYDTIMFRMRWNANITRECLIQFDGRWYDIESFWREYHTNQIQITARERANQQVTLTT